MTAELPASWHIPVYLRRENANLFGVDSDFSFRLSETQKLLDSFGPGTGLGVRSVIPEKSFYTEIDWEIFRKSHLLARTERSFDPYSPETAAGRNATIGPCQYKGIGRTLGATREDWLHSWGGMKIREALVELIIDRALKRKAPGNSVPLFAGLLYTDSQSAAVIRDADFIRCDQIPGVMDPAEISFFRSRALRNHIEASVFRAHFEGQLNLFTSGFFHRSPTRGNITIEGKFLDHYSVEWMPLEQGLPLQLEFRPTDSSLSAEEVVEKGAYDSVTTNIDHLIRQLQVIADALGLLQIKIPLHAETREEIRSRFPEYRWLITLMEDRLKMKRRIRDLVLGTPSRMLTRTPYGTVLFQSSSFKARKISTFVDRKLKVAALGGTLFEGVFMEEILSEAATLFSISGQND